MMTRRRRRRRRRRRMRLGRLRMVSGLVMRSAAHRTWGVGIQDVGLVDGDELGLLGLLVVLEVGGSCAWPFVFGEVL